LRLVTQGERTIADGGPIPPEYPSWVGPGPARLWHTIATGEVVSKSRAGELAAAHWPDLAEPLLDIVAARAGRPVALTADHGRAAIELGRHILADQPPTAPGQRVGPRIDGPGR
jgi:streptomycin 3"-adenylyltransferase